MTAAGAQEKAHRTQAERRADSRRRLLDASVAVLCARGFSATTVAAVAKHAGLSVGCLQGHFPTRHDLMVAAVEHAVVRHRERLVAAVQALPAGPDRMLAGIDLLWQALQGEAFTAYLELVVAARTEPALQPHVERTAGRLADAADESFRALYEAPAPALPFADVMPVMVLSLLQGLRLGDIAMPARGDAARGIEALKHIHRLATQAAATGTGG